MKSELIQAKKGVTSEVTSRVVAIHNIYTNEIADVMEEYVIPNADDTSIIMLKNIQRKVTQKC